MKNFKFVSLGVILLLISACGSDDVDTFDIISKTEYNIQKNEDTTLNINTKNYNIISKLIVNSDTIDIYGLQKENYILENINNEELKVMFFDKSPNKDNAEIKTVESSFFKVEKININEPQYKIQILNNQAFNISKIVLILKSRTFENSIVFNLL